MTNVSTTQRFDIAHLLVPGQIEATLGDERTFTVDVSPGPDYARDFEDRKWYTIVGAVLCQHSTTDGTETVTDVAARFVPMTDASFFPEPAAMPALTQLDLTVPEAFEGDLSLRFVLLSSHLGHELKRLNAGIAAYRESIRATSMFRPNGTIDHQVSRRFYHMYMQAYCDQHIRVAEKSAVGV